MNTKIYSPLHFLSCHRGKERLTEAESTTLAGPWKTCQEKNEKTDFEFFLYFLVVLTCLFAVSSLQVRAWCETPPLFFFFGAHPKIGAVIFVCLYIFMADVQYAFLPLRVRLSLFITVCLLFLNIFPSLSLSPLLPVGILNVLFFLVTVY